jgi:hypothetical protein
MSSRCARTVARSSAPVATQNAARAAFCVGLELGQELV